MTKLLERNRALRDENNKLSRELSEAAGQTAHMFEKIIMVSLVTAASCLKRKLLLLMKTKGLDWTRTKTVIYLQFTVIYSWSFDLSFFLTFPLFCIIIVFICHLFYFVDGASKWETTKQAGATAAPCSVSLQKQKASKALEEVSKSFNSSCAEICSYKKLFHFLIWLRISACCRQIHWVTLMSDGFSDVL